MNMFDVLFRLVAGLFAYNIDQWTILIVYGFISAQTHAQFLFLSVQEYYPSTNHNILWWQT